MMPDVDDVSIVVPTFDRPVLLKSTIESALTQSAPAREIIVVDNGTNPATQAVLAGFGDRVRGLKIEPLGVQAARNAGIAHASSTWIALLDDDDLFRPDYLAAARPAMRDGRADVIGTDHRKFEDDRPDDKTNFELSPPGYWDGITGPAVTDDWSFVGRFPLERLLRRIPIYPSTMIVRKSHALAIGGYDPRVRGIVPEDIEFLVRALNFGALALVWKPLVDYRRHPGGMSASRFGQKAGRWEIFEFIRWHVPGLDPAFIAALDEDLPKRRAQLYDVAFHERRYVFARRMKPLLRPEDWTGRRRMSRAVLSLPSSLDALMNGALVQPVRRLRRCLRAISRPGAAGRS